MRVALVGLGPEVAVQVAAWLGDEGHLPRRFGSAAAFAASDESAMVAAVFCRPGDIAIVGEAAEMDCLLVTVGTEDAAAEDAHITPPLRRRDVLAALTP